MAATSGCSKRLALDQRQTGGVAAVKMQKVESVVDQLHPALAVARRLRLREAWQSIFADAAQFAVEIGALRPHIREGGNDARIFVAPIEAASASAIVPARDQGVRTCGSRRV